MWYIIDDYITRREKTQKKNQEYFLNFLKFLYGPISWLRWNVCNWPSILLRQSESFLKLSARADSEQNVPYFDFEITDLFRNYNLASGFTCEVINRTSVETALHQSAILQRSKWRDFFKL